ncbi:hypothetical protein CC1G_15568 [Coprinopsis cinerea okayama7|uniref:Uncharacterized protein n=1 Tax=Coprinopsis cinerea (strain Okayama-7 / 130 / ATCC MYA-4618 / FGSC 9003) TaxID=240176 RepID=D6RNA9_COPC7|nr:hypothetical protein CC1G_15568 [Coprinopsis cinerea okayama7\|eukprot:XP_002911025.1 hypothetical protein CC1G_15568 [Coprinopsis cinerea okayama7\
MDFKYSPPGNSPELVTNMFTDLDNFDGATMQQFMYYLSSRLRGAGLAYAHQFAKLTIDQRAEFLRILFEEVTWVTTLFGFAAARFPTIKPGDTHRELTSLVAYLRFGDPMPILAACTANNEEVPDRLLAHFECNWWEPFDPTKNWDASNVSFIAKTFRHQRHFLLPLNKPPLPSNRLADLSTRQLAQCADSIAKCSEIVAKDIDLTAREISKAVNLFCRWKALCVKARLEEDRRRHAARVEGLSKHGLSRDVVADVLALQLAFTAFARDPTGRLWKSRQNQFTAEFLQALHFVGMSQMFPMGDYVNEFTAKLVEDWDVIFDEVEKGSRPDYSKAEGWLIDPLPFHEVMPLAWWKWNGIDLEEDTAAGHPPPKHLNGIQESLTAWRAYCTLLTSQGPSVSYTPDYTDSMADCLQGLASYRDGAADMLDSNSQSVIPTLQAAVNRISDICLYPLYLGWHHIGSRETTLARRKEYYRRREISGISERGNSVRSAPARLNTATSAAELPARWNTATSEAQFPALKTPHLQEDSSGSVTI